MKHSIDPTVDCVFKAILGAEEHKNLLLHFLNNVVKPPVPLQQVELLNPYNEKEFLSDKLTVVDVKAHDETGIVYQIEIQLAVHAFLPERMLYTWSDLYQSQLVSGESFKQLRPVISIWLLTQPLITDSSAYHHCFQLYDSKNKRLLSSHCSIHILELSKWTLQQPETLALEAEDLWCYFFRNAKRWEELPPLANTLEMRQAMSVLRQFSEREANYHRYQARQNFIREQITIKEELEDAQQELQGTQHKLQGTQHKLQGTQQELQGTQQKLQVVQQEKEKLLALLKQAGVDSTVKPS